MKFNFSKMHGAGNDFVVIDGVNQSVKLAPSLIRAISDRHLGIGCDQLLLLEAARDEETLFYYRIFNADGHEVEQCGNGARCIARFIIEQDLASSDTALRLGTLAGPIELTLVPPEQVKVMMGVPKMVSKEPFSINVAGETLDCMHVDMGNPHAILRVDSVDDVVLNPIGRACQHLANFKAGVNVNIVETKARDHVKLRVFERGVGETLACGSGASATVACGIYQGWLDTDVTVDLPGGSLQIQWDGGEAPLYLTGPAVTVFHGTYEA